MKRFLSPHVIVDGHDCGLSLVTVDDSDRAVSVGPFERETAATVFTPNAISIASDGTYTIEDKNSK